MEQINSVTLFVIGIVVSILIGVSGFALSFLVRRLYSATESLTKEVGILSAKLQEFQSVSNLIVESLKSDVTQSKSDLRLLRDRMHKINNDVAVNRMLIDKLNVRKSGNERN